jgi:hypothetical protein
MFRTIFKSAKCAKCMLQACQQAQYRSIHTSGALRRKLSDFQLRKITQEFDHMYDMDGDGYIDKKELSVFKKRLRSYMETIKGEAVKDVYGAGYEDFWEVLRDKAKVDKHGRINREEWIKLWEGVIEKAGGEISFKKLPQFVQMMPRAIFPVMDTKADGILDRQEYQMFWHHVGHYPLTDPTTLDHIYEVLTENGTHELNLKRVEDLYADFYLSDDPESAGRYIAGPIVFT